MMALTEGPLLDEPLPLHLRKIDSLDSDSSSIDLILIPGPGLPEPEDWTLWPEDISTSLQQLGVVPRILAFDHRLKINEHFSWRGLLNAGDELIEALLNLPRGVKEPRPKIFICHSLGGVILKHAISKMKQRNSQNSKLQNLLPLISGMVFLGTPHKLEGKETFESAILRLLKCCSRKFDPSNLVKEDFWILDDVARRFKDADPHIETLSIFEGMETEFPSKSRLRLKKKSDKCVVISEECCKTAVYREQVWGLQQNHRNLCALKDVGSDQSPKLNMWLPDAIKISIEICTQNLQELNFISKSSSSLSSVSSEAMRTALTRGRSQESNSTLPTSGQATAGSSDFDGVIVPLLDSFTPERKIAKLPCYMMGTFQPNEGFVGRHDVLDQLDAALLPGNGSTVSCDPCPQKYAAIYGMGGLGKTEIAVKYVHSRQHHFDAIFWLCADSREKLDRDLANVAIKLGLANSDEKVAENQVVLCDIAKGWLASPKTFTDSQNDSIGTAEAKWLLVLDNADDYDILSDYHFFGGGSVLVTSRNPHSAMSSSDISLSIPLEPLSDVESARLLRQVAGKARQADRSLEIVKELGGIPLVISQMAGIIKKLMLTDDRFLQLYADRTARAKLLSHEAVRLSETARGNVATIWAIENLTPAAKYFISILSFLDPDELHESFTENLQQTQERVHDIAYKAPADAVELAVARGELLEQSLIRSNATYQKLWVHRVLQETVRSKLGPTRLEAFFAHVVDLLKSAWPKAALKNRHNTDRWVQCALVYPHILHLRQVKQIHRVEMDRNTELSYAELLNEAGWWQLEKGNSHSSHVNRQLLKDAYEICEKHDGARSRDLRCNIHYSLGAVANESNDAKSCVKHNTIFLDIRLDERKTHGKADIWLAIAYNQMGTGHMMQKDFAKAEACFRSAMKAYHELDDFDEYMLSIPIANIGLAYWLQGKLDDAYNILIEGLCYRERKFGKDDHESFRTGRLLHALGNVRASQGYLEESESYHQRAFLSYKNSIGENHHRTADVCHKVAQHYFRRKEYHKAMKLVEQALKVWETDWKAYSPEICRTTYLKASIHFGLNEEKTAFKLFKSAATELDSWAPCEERKSHELLTEKDFDNIVTFWSK